MKAIRLPSIAGQGSKTSGRIAEATRRGSDATYGLLSTLGSVELLLLSALGIGQALESGARTAADNLVALSGCAFFETGAASDVSLKIENYMNDLERASMLAVSLADRAGGTLASVLETILVILYERLILFTGCREQSELWHFFLWSKDSARAGKERVHLVLASCFTQRDSSFRKRSVIWAGLVRKC